MTTPCKRRANTIGLHHPEECYFPVCSELTPVSSWFLLPWSDGCSCCSSFLQVQSAAVLTEKPSWSLTPGWWAEGYHEECRHLPNVTWIIHCSNPVEHQGPYPATVPDCGHLQVLVSFCSSASPHLNFTKKPHSWIHLLSQTQKAAWTCISRAIIVCYSVADNYLSRSIWAG